MNARRTHRSSSSCYDRDSEWDTATITSGRFDSGASVHDMPPSRSSRDIKHSKGIPRHVGVNKRREEKRGYGRQEEPNYHHQDRVYPRAYGEKYLSRLYSQAESSDRTPETTSLTNSHSSDVQSFRRTNSGESSHLTEPTMLDDSRRNYDGRYREPNDRYLEGRGRGHPYHPSYDDEDRRPYHPQNERPPPSYHRHSEPPRELDYQDPDPYYLDHSDSGRRSTSYGERHPRHHEERRRMPVDQRSFAGEQGRDYGMRSRGPPEGRGRPYMERGYSPYDRVEEEEEEYDRRPPPHSYPEDRGYHRPSYEDRRRYHDERNRPGEERSYSPRRRHGNVEEEHYSRNTDMPPRQFSRTRMPPKNTSRSSSTCTGQSSRMPSRNTSRSSTVTSSSRPRFSDEAAYQGEAVVMVDISPGVKARLRRIQETLEAVANDYYTAVNCLACNRELFCIADSSWFLCPDCKVISPMSEHVPDHNGLGMGFTAKTLIAMQADIFAKKQQQPCNPSAIPYAN